MPRSYPGDELSVEQLVYALARALDPNAPSRRWAYRRPRVPISTHTHPFPEISSSQDRRRSDIGIPRHNPVIYQYLPPYDSQISVVEQDLCGILRTTREIMNTSIPISKLPPEILSRILEHRVHEQTLIAATHVCQYWRSTLIFNPSLWTCFLFVTQPDVARTLAYLERSKLTPIDVSITMGSPQSAEALEYLAPHASRMRFCLIDGSDTDAQMVFSLFHNPAPLLRRLEIYSYECSRLSQTIPSFTVAAGAYQCPSPFSLPNLTEFTLSRRDGAGSFRLNTVFQFLSYAPRLQKLRISTTDGILQEIALDQVISLESLVELEYNCRPADRILPCLRLPRLKQLQVYSSPESGQQQNLVDILPHRSHLLLAGMTNMEYSSDWYSHKVALSGKEVDVSFVVSRTTTGSAPLDWFFDETYIPLGQIKELVVEGWSVTPDFPFNPFRSLEVLRVYPCDPSIEGFWRALYPGAGLACRSLREIRYECRGSLPDLVSLVRERKKVGHQVGLVWLLAEHEPDQGLVEELREYAGEVRV